MLFDWLVVGQVVAINPAHAVRAPKHIVRRGKTPVLIEEQARRLLASIKTVRKTKLPDGTEVEQPWVVGLRDRALIGVMTYSFARISAVVGMKVEDYYPAGKRWWVRLHEKAASSTRCRRITSSSSFSMNISPQPESAMPATPPSSARRSAGPGG